MSSIPSLKDVALPWSLLCHLSCYPGRLNPTYDLETLGQSNHEAKNEDA